MRYSDGDSYRGGWRDGKYDGQGEYRCGKKIKSQKVISFFKKKMFDWTSRWSDTGNVYVGDWVDGSAHGQGEFRSDMEQKVPKLV